MSTMEYEEIMRSFTRGEPGEKELIRKKGPIMKRIAQVEEKIRGKRDKRKWFFEELLSEPENGILCIYIIDRLRYKIEKEIDEKGKGLDSVLREWKLQRKDPETNDTLTQVVFSRASDDTLPLVFQCFVVVAHCRRIRQGTGLINKNSEISRRLSQVALSTWKLLDEEDKDKDNFSFTPTANYDLQLNLQSLLCDSRFGDIHELEKDAKKLLEDIETRRKDSAFEKYELWRPELNILWWVSLVRLRSAAVRSDLERWKKIRSEMEDYEKIGEISGMLKSHRKRSRNIRDVSVEYPVFRGIEVVNRLLRSWKEFDSTYKENMLIRKNRRTTIPGYESANEKYRNFNNSLHDFNKYVNHFKKNHQSAVRHAFSTRKKDRREKCKRLISEISTQIQSICISNNFYTVHLLEIFHRLLIYRIWWESLDYLDDKKPLLNLSSLKRVLEKIKAEIRSRTKSTEVENTEVQKSIDLIKDLEKWNESDDSEKGTSLLKKTKDDLEYQISRWRDSDESNKSKPKVSKSIMGIFYVEPIIIEHGSLEDKGILDGETKEPTDPHEFIDPMMPVVGPRTGSNDLSATL